MARKKMNAFLAVVNEIIKRKRTDREVINIYDVYVEASNHTAPCYYVNLNFAARQLTMISRYGKPSVVGKLKKQMYFDIYNEYLKVTNQKKISKLDWNVLGMILNREAKSFYINPDCVQQLINIYYRK